MACANPVAPSYTSGPAPNPFAANKATVPNTGRAAPPKVLDKPLPAFTAPLPT
jgi:hypothetical protein